MLQGESLRKKPQNVRKKVLLMGKSGAGKTSMKSIIFANFIARDTRKLGPTNEIEHSYVRFLGNLVLHLWDCGGEQAFVESYFIPGQKDTIFRDLEVLIYVFDVESRELDQDLLYYQKCIEAVTAENELQHTSSAKFFCLIHKMDLISEQNRKFKFDSLRKQALDKTPSGIDVSFYQTSIWDETLYEAWSKIVHQLIPNVAAVESALHNFASLMDAEEVLLFEKATFLVISKWERGSQNDEHRFEKISNIIKQFKLSCTKLADNFSSIEVRNSSFSAFIEQFTTNTYIMVVMSDTRITSAAVLMNIRNVRGLFEKIESSDRSIGRR